MTFDTPEDDRPVALVVEDQPTTLKLMSAWLEMSGYRVLQATDGCQAWESAQRDCPRIVVTDWNMPRMSGLELCRYIRSKHPCHQVYVLIATAREGQHDMTAAMDAGANDFLAKPVTEHEFVARIRNAENALKLLQSQAELAETDSLTGTRNRRSFEEQCQRETQRADDLSQPLSCIVLDVDLFKQINDTYGHSVGDSILVTVAKILNQESRQHDVVCRLGGDEFCVLLPQTGEDEAVQVAERIRRRIVERPILVEDRSVTVHATLGVASWSKDVGSPDQLIDLADQALLVAKNAGRNRVMRLGEAASREPIASSGDPTSLALADSIANDIMTSSVISLGEDQPLYEVIELFLKHTVDCAPVVDDRSELVGMVSERDLLNALSVSDGWNLPARTVMTSNVVSFDGQTPATIIWECLLRTPSLRVVIVNDGSPVGLVGRRALLQLIHDYRAEMPRRFPPPIGCREHLATPTEAS